MVRKEIAKRRFQLKILIGNIILFFWNRCRWKSHEQTAEKEKWFYEPEEI